MADPARSLHAEMETEPEEEEGWLRGEAVQVYKQLRTLALQLNTGHDDDSGKTSNKIIKIGTVDYKEIATFIITKIHRDQKIT